MSDKVSNSEVTDILRKVGEGVVTPSLKYPDHPWDDVYAGSVYYLVDGWEITIFNDCNSWDYIEAVISPDGRRSEFDDLYLGGVDPDDMLAEECWAKMHDAFINAT